MKGGSRRLFSTKTTDVYDIDYESLLPGQWLRTNALAYALEKLTGQHTAATGAAVPVVTIDPSVVQTMVTFGSAALGPAGELAAAPVVLLPVADYAAGSLSGNGEHWSLLIVCRLPTSPPSRGQSSGDEVAMAVHCDSCGTRNMAHASGILSLLHAWQPSRFPCAERLLRCAWFPQQPNGYDCGAYVIMAVQLVLGVLNTSGSVTRVVEVLRGDVGPAGDQPSAEAIRRLVRQWMTAEAQSRLLSS
jgi:hypothetical protein